DYQNMGVGTALMEALLDVADNWLMLIRVELTVFEDNKRAIHLYEKFGFEKEGLKRLASIRNGKYENEYLMARINPSYIKE
ncbi:GNAT family N-acetyltransferase, partial [Clostridium perfringens]|nr:GNAT family N-acetyltransferase [Clostridium perfringens]